MTSTMSRRAILAGAASSAAASPALALPAGPHPDAELISLGEQMKALLPPYWQAEKYAHEQHELASELAGRNDEGVHEAARQSDRGHANRQWPGDHAAVPGDQDAGPARGAAGPDREHRGGIWHDTQSHELTSRIEDLAERRTPRRGPLIIVGADKAECRKRLEEILATGEQPAHVRFLMTGVPRSDRYRSG